MTNAVQRVLELKGELALALTEEADRHLKAGALIAAVAVEQRRLAVEQALADTLHVLDAHARGGGPDAASVTLVRHALLESLLADLELSAGEIRERNDAHMHAVIAANHARSLGVDVQHRIVDAAEAGAEAQRSGADARAVADAIVNALLPA